MLPFDLLPSTGLVVSTNNEPQEPIEHWGVFKLNYKVIFQPEVPGTFRLETWILCLRMKQVHKKLSGLSTHKISKKMIVFKSPLKYILKKTCHMVSLTI